MAGSAPRQGVFAVDLEALPRSKKRRAQSDGAPAGKKARGVDGPAAGAQHKDAEDRGSFLAHMLDEEEFTLGDAPPPAPEGTAIPGFAPPPVEPSEPVAAAPQEAGEAEAPTPFAFPAYRIFRDAPRFAGLFRRQKSADDVRKAFDQNREALRALCQRLRKAAKAAAEGVEDGTAAEGEPAPLPEGE
eukprot:EG_transcript_25837